jgi:hypothetical protein
VTLDLAQWRQAYALFGALPVGGAAFARPDPFPEGDGISAY